VSKRPAQISNATPWGAIVSLFMALLYGASPIDLIPDLIPILGFVDDALIVPILLLFAFFQYKRARARNEPATQRAIVIPPERH
jgi:uncharacterized membrane protein YkvA (DUF1232 family)